MPRIFISYRREDSQEITGRIYDRLVTEVAADEIFRDIDNIPSGVDFREVVDREIGRCDVVLVIVGPRWLSSVDKNGKRRLDNANDFVRLEVEAALARGIRVIPVLVSNADMPAESDLPTSIAKFAYRNARAVRPDPDFHRDMDVLLADISNVGENGGTTANPVALAGRRSGPVPRLAASQKPPPAAPTSTSHRRARWLIAGGVLIVSVALAWAFWPDQPGDAGQAGSVDSGNGSRNGAGGAPGSATDGDRQTANRGEGTQAGDSQSTAQRVDLLALIDPSRDRVRGQWSVNDRRLTCEPPRRGGKVGAEIRIPYEPPEEYRLSLRTMRANKEPGMLTLGLTSGNARFTVVIDSLKGKQPANGLMLVDDKRLLVPAIRRALPPGQTVLISCTVSKSGVVVHADDDLLFDWGGKTSQLSRGAIFSSVPMFLGTGGDAAFTFREIELEPLGDDAGRSSVK